MSRLQRIAKAILPKKFAENMEAASRKWRLECHTCGLRRSVWDHGGIRYGASGKSATFVNCTRCGCTRLHSTVYVDE